MELIDYPILATGLIVLVAFATITVSVWQMLFKDWKKD